MGGICVTKEEYQAAARYWEEKDADSVKLEPGKLRSMVEEYIQSNNTCALATGTGDYVRCTPIEYSWHDGCFWMFSEGGKKFIGLEKNPHVCLAIYDRYEGFGSLHGMQVVFGLLASTACSLTSKSWDALRGRRCCWRRHCDRSKTFRQSR